MKKALINLIITISLGLILVAVLVIVEDPFFHYHAPGKSGAYLYNEMYQTPGMARHFSYDTIMLGTSMTENFQTDWFEQYGEHAVKLSYSGARVADIIRLMEQAYASGNNISHIYMDINDYQLSESRGAVFGTPPGYLYDDNILTDVQYIYNKDVVIAALDRLMSTTCPNDNTNDSFTWVDENLFGRDRVLEDISADREMQEWVNNSEDIKKYLECASENLNDLCEYIDNHSQTTFTIFYPPYSAVYWWDLREKNQLDGKIDMYVKSVYRLAACENVEIYFFMDDYELISNLDEYRDMCHYKMEVNKYMLDCMHQGTWRVDEENMEIRMEALKNYMLTYEP